MTRCMSQLRDGSGLWLLLTWVSSVSLDGLSCALPSVINSLHYIPWTANIWSGFCFPPLDWLSYTYNKTQVKREMTWKNYKGTWRSSPGEQERKSLPWMPVWSQHDVVGRTLPLDLKLLKWLPVEEAIIPIVVPKNFHTHFCVIKTISFQFVQEADS